MSALSEKYFLEKCIVSVEDAKASISSISNLNLDKKTKDTYKNMMEEIGKYIEFIHGRIEYLKKSE